MHVELERIKWFLKTTNAKQEEDKKKTTRFTVGLSR